MSFNQFYRGMMGPSWESEMELRRSEASLKSAASEASQDIRQLQIQVDKLRLVCRSLCEALINETQLTEDALLNLIDEIDQRDGNLDGRMKPQPVKCTACNRNAGAGKVRCQYCGEPVDSASDLDRKF